MPQENPKLRYRTARTLSSPLGMFFSRATYAGTSEEAARRPLPLLSLTFRLGFAGVFLINSLTAWLEPAAFSALLSHGPTALLTRAVGLGPLLTIIMVNDLVLGVLILTGRWKAHVLAWAGVWLLAVTVVKTVSLSG